MQVCWPSVRIIIHFTPLHSIKVILLLTTIFSWYNFSVLVCLHSFSDSQLLFFFCAFLFNPCFNVCGSCLQEEEVAESGVSVEMNATEMKIVRLLTYTASYSLMHAQKIACILLTLSTYIPDKCLLLTR